VVERQRWFGDLRRVRLVDDDRAFVEDGSDLAVRHGVVPRWCRFHLPIVRSQHEGATSYWRKGYPPGSWGATENLGGQRTRAPAMSLISRRRSDRLQTTFSW
jgi:hypothetical protein